MKSRKIKQNLLILSLIAAMAFSLTACSEEEEETSSEESVVSEESEEESEEETEEEAEEESEETADDDTETTDESEVVTSSTNLSADEIAWSGTLSDLDVEISYDESTYVFTGTITNNTDYTITGVEANFNILDADEASLSEFYVVESISLASGESTSFEVDITDEEEHSYWEVNVVCGEIYVDLASSYEIDEDDVYLTIAFDEDTGLFEGTITNNTGADLSSLSITLDLDNASSYEEAEISILTDEEYEFSFDVSAEIDYTAYMISFTISE